MTNNVCCAIKASDCEVQKDDFMIRALVQDVLNVSEEVLV